MRKSVSATGSGIDGHGAPEDGEAHRHAVVARQVVDELCSAPRSPLPSGSRAPQALRPGLRVVVSA